MNTFTPEQTKLLQTTVTVASTLNIESVVIRDDIIFGMDDTQSTLILDKTHTNIFKSPIVLTRVPVIKQRLNLIEKQGPFVILYDENIPDSKSKDAFIKKIQLANKRTTVDFRCGGLSRVNVRTNLHDPKIASLNITKEIKEFISEAKACTEGDKIVFTFDEDSGLTLSFPPDSQGDTIEQSIDSNLVTLVSKIKGKIAFKYRVVDIIMALKSGSGVIDIGEKGFISTQISNIASHVFPKKV